MALPFTNAQRKTLEIMMEFAWTRWMAGFVALFSLVLRAELSQMVLETPPATTLISASVTNTLEGEFNAAPKAEISESEFEQKRVSFGERVKGQKLARTILLSKPNPRGQILLEYYNERGDRDYTSLARSKNGRYFQIDFSPIIKETDPLKIYEFAKAQLAWVNQVLGRNETISEYEVLTYFEHRRWIPLRVGSMLTRQEVDSLGNRALPEGLAYLDMPIRHYPRGSVAGHVLGAVKRSKGWPLREFAEGDELYPPIDGISGIEKSQNAVLNGIPTVYRYEFGDDGLLKSEPVVVTRGRAGLNIVLSLDVQMQELAESLLKKHTAKSGTGKGAMVVVDIANMQIKALASWPVIDPNDFVPVLTSEVEAKWKSDPNNPKLARAFQAAYPPASTFKLATGLMALSSKVLGGDEYRYRCFDSMTYGENTMKNWTQESGEPEMRVTDALKRSCNTWFFQAANEMQSRGKAFEKWFHHLMPMLGLGKKTGLELFEEVSGYAYVKEGREQPFFEGANVANISIGQGDLATTPLQLAQMVARMADPMQNVKAYLVRGRQTESGEWAALAKPVDEEVSLIASQRELAWIRRGMWDVVYGNFGTGPLAQPRKFSVAGKTGTAQWSQDRNVAWFASYAPFFDGSPAYSAPAKYAVVVMQEGNSGQTLSGGNHAAPVVGEFFADAYVEERMLVHLGTGRSRSSLRAKPVKD